MIYLVSESHRYGCHQDMPNGKCIGKHCAAWRWHDDLIRRTATPSVKACDEELRRLREYFSVSDARSKIQMMDEEPARPESVPASWEWCPASENADGFGIWVEPVSEAMRRRRGYCGLAGKPEVIE